MPPKRPGEIPPRSYDDPTQSGMNSQNAQRPTTPTTPQLTRHDPSLITAATASKNRHRVFSVDHLPTTVEQEEPRLKRCLKSLYNKEKKELCGRTALSWFQILLYSVMYLIFLITYTLVFLYVSLLMVKSSQHYAGEVLLLRFTANDVGISATPTSVSNYPVIWYRNGNTNDYDKYVKAVDELLLKTRAKRETSSLGPCGRFPYGYGEKPCVILRINKEMKWSAEPLRESSPNVKDAPVQVQNWAKSDPKKYWLHCSGYHSYDTEHIGNIKYYPDPPGFDSREFPLNMNGTSPLVAVQLSNFTLGLSILLQCNVWYENGRSSIEFMIYVTDKNRVSKNNISTIRY